MTPLAGLTVVSVEQAVAAPLASRHLADLGARVIKIERPGTGDFARQYDTTVRGMSSHFVWLNRSKESLTLDLKHEAGPEVLRGLVGRADVFLHNLAPGAIGRLGFDRQSLRLAFPRLIICEISGYGADGAYRDKKAYDLLVQSEVGLLSVTGTQDSPAKAGIPVADIAAGMYAFSGILAALFERSRTGAGAVVEISLFDALAEWMGYPMYFTEYGGSMPPRSGAHHASIAPYGPYLAADGRTIYLAIQNERGVDALLQRHPAESRAGGGRAFAGNASRVANRIELDIAISSVFAALSADEIVARLDEHDIANARTNTVEEFLRHPQLASGNRWQTVDSPVGPLRALRPPISFGGAGAPFRPIPILGQHTDDILRELGFSATTVAAWRRAGAI